MTADDLRNIECECGHAAQTHALAAYCLHYFRCPCTVTTYDVIAAHFTKQEVPPASPATEIGLLAKSLTDALRAEYPELDAHAKATEGAVERASQEIQHVTREELFDVLAAVTETFGGEGKELRKWYDGYKGGAILPHPQKTQR